ncbi:MAG TPA: hypothetical protein VGE74_31535, partial [Gemmata sp.]
LDIGDVRCRLVGIELAVESEPDLLTWAVAVGQLDAQRERSLWLLGDLVVYGVDRFGADAWDQLGALGYASETSRKAHRVSARFPSGIRIPQVTWSHHRVVCRLDVSAALALLRRAVRERLSTAALKELVAPPVPRVAPLVSRAERERLPGVAARYGLTEEQGLAFLQELRAV